MNARQLLSLFDRINEAEEAVLRLRRFILDLAVRGKLVPQDANEEPASELLIQIAAERARRTRAGQVRGSKAVHVPATDHFPFPLPPTWRWSRLSEIGVLSPRNEAADSAKASFVSMTMIAAEYGVAHSHQVRLWGDIKKGYTHFAEGDVGLAKITPCFENAKSTVFRNLAGGIGSGTTELHVVRPLIVSPDYILIFLKCPYFIEAGIPRMTGTAGQKRVPVEYFACAPFPLPPLAEQCRIVAKLDELMALCDRLEAARVDREATRDRLTTASLARLNAPDTDAAKFADHARFALDNFVQLTSRPDQVNQLRRTVLNLAVRGKLVPQDPQDETASIALERSDSVRQEVAVGDRRADAAEQSLLAEEERWPVPSSWQWRALADLVLFIDYRGKTPTKTQAGVRLITAKNVKKGFVNLEPEEFVSRAEYKAWMTRGYPAVGDVLFTTEAPMGNAAVVRLTEPFALAQRTINFRPYGAIDPDFLVLQLLAEPFQAILDKTATGLTAKGIKAAKLKRLPIAVPPIAEQRRIVTKVDELMALCDRLEESLTVGENSRSRLLEAVLHEALAATLEEAA
jgi:type I restriction enzyme S subunit